MWASHHSPIRLDDAIRQARQQAEHRKIKGIVAAVREIA
jgi:hypothetical protein